MPKITEGTMPFLGYRTWYRISTSGVKENYSLTSRYFYMDSLYLTMYSEYKWSAV